MVIRTVIWPRFYAGCPVTTLLICPSLGSTWASQPRGWGLDAPTGIRTRFILIDLFVYRLEKYAGDQLVVYQVGCCGVDLLCFFQNHTHTIHTIGTLYTLVVISSAKPFSHFDFTFAEHHLSTARSNHTMLFSTGVKLQCHFKSIQFIGGYILLHDDRNITSSF